MKLLVVCILVAMCTVALAAPRDEPTKDMETVENPAHPEDAGEPEEAEGSNEEGEITAMEAINEFL